MAPKVTTKNSNKEEENMPKKKTFVSDKIYRYPKLSKAQKNTILPLIHILRDLSPDYRMIILSHLDEISRDLMYRALRSVLFSNDEIMGSKKSEIVNNFLQPHSKDVSYMLDPFKSETMRKQKLIKVGGAAIQPVLDACIPIFLCMCKSK